MGNILRLPERPGQGRAVPRFIHQSRRLLALERVLICLTQHGGGGLPGLPGQDTAWGLDAEWGRQQQVPPGG